MLRMAQHQYDLVAKSLSKSIPKLATKYIGRKIANEMKDDTRLGSRMQRQMGVLFALTGELKALEGLFRALLYEFAARYPASSLQCEATRATYRWCAEQVNMTGYAELFDGLITAQDEVETASREISRYVTESTEKQVRYYGTPGDPFAKMWALDKIPTMQLFLEEIAWLTVFRQYPEVGRIVERPEGSKEFFFGNNLGWSAEQFDEELAANTIVVRKFLGLDPKLPEYPENPRVDIPPEFTNFP